MPSPIQKMFCSHWLPFIIASLPLVHLHIFNLLWIICLVIVTQTLQRHHHIKYVWLINIVLTIINCVVTQQFFTYLICITILYSCYYLFTTQFSAFVYLIGIIVVHFIFFPYSVTQHDLVIIYAVLAILVCTIQMLLVHKDMLQHLSKMLGKAIVITASIILCIFMIFQLIHFIPVDLFSHIKFEIHPIHIDKIIDNQQQTITTDKSKVVHHHLSFHSNNLKYINYFVIFMLLFFALKKLKNISFEQKEEASYYQIHHISSIPTSEKMYPTFPKRVNKALKKLHQICHKNNIPIKGYTFETQYQYLPNHQQLIKLLNDFRYNPNTKASTEKQLIQCIQDCIQALKEDTK